MEKRKARAAVASSPLGRRADRVFYTGMAVAAAAAVFLGFARTYYLRPQFQASPLPLVLHVHGALFSAWIGLLVAQTTLVAARRTDLHRRLGWAGAVLAAAMVVAGLTAAVVSLRGSIAAGAGEPALAFFAVPVGAMLVFAILVAAAVGLRRRPEAHKRLMLLATIHVMDAAVARWPLELVATTTWGYYVLTDLFIAIGVLYDAVSRRRVHPAYLWGGLLIVVGQVVREAVGRTEAWMAFARAVLE